MLSNVRHHSISIFSLMISINILKLIVIQERGLYYLALYLTSLKVTQFEIKYFL